MGKIIGITTMLSRSNEIKKYTNKHLEGINLLNVSSDYPNAISDSGGIPMLIPVLETYDEKTIQNIIQSINGLLLTGGEDIDPKFYREKNLQIKEHALMKRDPERDSFELALLKEAFKAKIPILGICRGQQLINVCFGGSLYGDIRSNLNSNINHLASLEDKMQLIHQVNIKEDSVLNEIYNSQELFVNSFHHQCISRLAKKFDVIAISDDKVIEGIVYKGPEWILGVQWHPEMLYKKYRVHGRLFKKFIEIVNKKS